MINSLRISLVALASVILGDLVFAQTAVPGASANPFI